MITSLKIQKKRNKKYCEQTIKDNTPPQYASNGLKSKPLIWIVSLWSFPKVIIFLHEYIHMFPNLPIKLNQNFATCLSGLFEPLI